MSIDPIFHKIHALVVPHGIMLELMNEEPDAPLGERISGQAWAGRWFEITQQSYNEMFEMMPPRLMAPDMFALSELKAGAVGSVFFEIVIAGKKRWFHGFCCLSDRDAPTKMRTAIILWETGDATGLTRDQKLDAIWSFTHRGFRGHLRNGDGAANAGDLRGSRTILIYEPGFGTVLKRLADLTDNEIAAELPRHRAR